MAGVCATAQISHRHHMRVDEARSRRLRRQLVSNMAVSRNLQALLLGRAVHQCRDDLTMPVDESRGIRVVGQIDSHRADFMKADERPGNSSVVSDSTYGVI